MSSEQPESHRAASSDGGWRLAGWVAAAALLALITWRSLGDRGESVLPVADLARLEPLPLSMPSSDSALGSLAVVGLDAYRQGDWLAAAATFEPALRVDPGRDDVAVLLASCRLLAGQDREATELLQPLVARSGSPVEREALWLLAQAYLLQERRDEAEASLRRLTGISGAFANDAQVQLEELSLR